VQHTEGQAQAPKAGLGYARGVLEADRQALRAEALRIHDRYVREVVEALSLCPWAAAAREQGSVCTEVVFGREGDDAMLARVVELVAALEADERVEIGLVVMPELGLGRIAMQHFAARLRARYQPETSQRAFAIADFHPDAAPRVESPEQLVAFIRSSPDPSLQLVRRSAIESVRLGAEPGTRFVDAAALAEGGLAALTASAASPPSLSERVARANLRTVQELGVEHVQALLADIAADRDRSYARLGLAPPSWRAHGEVR
jgi:hypothetical protein